MDAVCGKGSGSLDVRFVLVYECRMSTKITYMK